MMEPHFTNRAIKRFYAKHGNFVQLPDSQYVLFEDGALHENSSSGIGPLIPPPSDEWECAKLVAQFWKIKAEAAQDEFHQFKSYLNGDGWCPPGLDTDEEKLAYLKKLRAEAAGAAKQYRMAREEVDATTPAWLIRKQKDEAEERRVREKLRERANAINL